MPFNSGGACVIALAAVAVVRREADMKVYILAAIIAASPTLSYAAPGTPAPSKLASYFQHLKKMTPRPIACGGKGAKCEGDSDCCVGWVCISKECQ